MVGEVARSMKCVYVCVCMHVCVFVCVCNFSFRYLLFDRKQ